MVDKLGQLLYMGTRDCLNIVIVASGNEVEL